jgi:hypothetical protein
MVGMRSTSPIDMGSGIAEVAVVVLIQIGLGRIVKGCGKTTVVSIAVAEGERPILFLDEAFNF